MMKNWFAEFKRDRTSRNDELGGSGRPKKVTLSNMIEKADRIVSDDLVKAGEISWRSGYLK